MPGKSITLNEAITMTLRAVGYTANSSFLTGSWPVNYISIAQNEGLYDSVAGEAIVNRAYAAQIIYNALFVQKVTVSSDGETTYLENSSGDASTMLNTGLECTMEEGVVDYTTYPDSMIPLAPYMGAYGEIYLNDEGEVVAVNPTVTRLVGNFNNSGTKFTLAAGGNYDIKSSACASPASVFVTNSEREYTFTSTASCAAFYMRPVTVYADVSGDNITQIYSVNYWTTQSDNGDGRFKADSNIQDEISNDKTIGGYNLPL